MRTPPGATATTRISYTHGSTPESDTEPEKPTAGQPASFGYTAHTSARGSVTGNVAATTPSSSTCSDAWCVGASALSAREPRSRG